MAYRPNGRDSILYLQGDKIMTEILAVFRSRSQAMDCFSRLKKLGVNTQLINTPKEANVGCGLSVKFSAALAPKVKRFIASANYSAFYGYLKLNLH